MLVDLQVKYPGSYKKGQLRTLQRRVQEWRKNALITFDDKWLKEDLGVINAGIGNLRGKRMDATGETERFA